MRMPLLRSRPNSQQMPLGGDATSGGWQEEKQVAVPSKGVSFFLCWRRFPSRRSFGGKLCGEGDTGEIFQLISSSPFSPCCKKYCSSFVWTALRIRAPLLSTWWNWRVVIVPPIQCFENTDDVVKSASSAAIREALFNLRLWHTLILGPGSITVDFFRLMPATRKLYLRHADTLHHFLTLCFELV